eukprot:1195022-Prorocentrum_minimum.AAC.7
MAKGITGTGVGFDAPSVGRLGGRTFDHNPPASQLRQVGAYIPTVRTNQTRGEGIYLQGRPIR